MQSRLFMSVWKLIDLLFPPCCAGCGMWGERYCQSCFTKTRTITSSICQHCGEPLKNSNGSICERCQVSEIFYSAVRSWAIFEDPIKTAIHNLKYKRNIGLGEVLADPLAFLLDLCDWNIDLITAVPLDSKRLKERGFNQSVLLARPLAWISKISFNDQALTRIRYTRPQVGLTRGEREKNMEGVFEADSKIAKGKIILVVDDVITTGSTLNECSKALLDSGADQVFGLTLARSAHL